MEKFLGLLTKKIIKQNTLTYNIDIHFLAIIFFTFGYVFTPLIKTIFNENPLHYLNYFADDFYYYLKIAGNIVDHSMSSFDGITETNGYHPLWLLIIVITLKLCGGANFLFFSSILLIKFISGIITFHLFRKISKKLYEESYFTLIIVWLAYITFLIISDLMEIVIAIPLLAMLTLFILEEYDDVSKRPLKMLSLGFTASLLILSRLDAVIFVIIYIISFFIISLRYLKKALLKSVYFGLGGILFPIYLIMNKLYFNNFIPTSGQSKQLKTGLMPTFEVLSSVMRYRSPFLLIIQLTFILIFGALLMLLLNKKVLITGVRYRVIWLILLFPLFYYLIQDILSDWPVWYWYFYPIPLAFLISAIVAIKFFKNMLAKINVNPKFIYITFLILLFLLPLKNFVKDNANARFLVAEKLNEFQRENKGIYAMGDSAGFIGYFTQLPLIQLEGMAADQKMIEHIRKQDNLISVLKEYGVDFYITKNPKFISGVYYLIEPKMGGKNSYKMQGELNSSPVLSLDIKNISIKIFKIK